MRQNYDGLQFAEIKEQISSFCSFSVGHQIIENSEPQFSRLVVQLHLDRLKQALTMTIKYGSMPFAGHKQRGIPRHEGCHFVVQ